MGIHRYTLVYTGIPVYSRSVIFLMRYGCQIEEQYVRLDLTRVK